MCTDRLLMAPKDLQNILMTSRNVLRESARIARGKISPLADLNISSHDAVVFPGGFGAAKNLVSPKRG